MADFIKKLLATSGDVSMVRVMAICSLTVGAVIGLYGVYKGRDLSGLAQVCGVFVGSAFAAKVTQKFAEGKEVEKD